MPFCLLSKKRYVGMLYEEGPNVDYVEMGIVLKRRDNAPISRCLWWYYDILMKSKILNGYAMQLYCRYC